MAKQVTRTRRMTIPAPPEVVFPLLCPVREHDYLDYWQADILHSDSGLAEKGCIFQTPGPETWYIAEHDRQAGRIVFIIFADSRLSRLEVELREQTEGSLLTFTYTHSALDAAGERFVEDFSQELFAAKMERFESGLKRYLLKLEV